MKHVEILNKNNFDNFKLSIKSSDIYMAIESYEKISELIDKPLHFGGYESGSLKSTFRSSIGFGAFSHERYWRHNKSIISIRSC
ncbi:MAG: hypothetical protein CM15mP22_7580 [Gammaproteobacteria bacterium]|nr:MAG: hypothetical protein CM15mP22_7580 [Gammaproteobacteria bacterium]